MYYYKELLQSTAARVLQSTAPRYCSSKVLLQGYLILLLRLDDLWRQVMSFIDMHDLRAVRGSRDGFL